MKNDIKEEFISTLSHEIRTPLTSIKGFSQTILSGWDKLNDDKKKEFLTIIAAQAQRLINLTENVLNVAKIDSDTEKLLLTKVSVNNIVQNCISIVKMAHKDFDFIFDKSPNELYCLIDNDKTQQVLLDILDNAVKYSLNSKKIEIKTCNKGDFNVFSIKNYGSYIEPENTEKIFTKFFRVDSYITSSVQGSGLGLYIAQSLVKKMKGKIEVKSSKEGKITEFLVYLPEYRVEELTKNIGV